MSVSQYLNTVKSLDKEIATLEKKKADLDKKSADAKKKASGVSINKNASPSTIKSKLQKAQTDEQKKQDKVIKQMPSTYERRITE